jgi:hypothetical protein
MATLSKKELAEFAPEAREFLRHESARAAFGAGSSDGVIVGLRERPT